MKKNKIETTMSTGPGDELEFLAVEKHGMKLIEKDASFDFSGNVFRFKISNVLTMDSFSQAVGIARSMSFSKEDDGYTGYMPWAKEFAKRVALITAFTNINTVDIEVEELWFFAFYSPVIDMITEACPEDVEILTTAIDDAVDIKRNYLIHKSDWIEMFTDMINKVGDMTQGFGDLDMVAMSRFLNSAQNLSGGDLVHGVLSGLSGLFKDDNDRDDSDIPETVIGSQWQDKKN